MKKHTMTLLGGTGGQLRVPADVLLEAVGALLEGARQATRFFVDGESTRKGPRPAWLDAHAHLGNMLFRTSPHWALSHDEVGVRIGELSLGADFDSVLAWGLIDNRPFLRCMLGYGLCLWRLERWEEAERVFERMLWMNPSDNQGIRGLLPDVRAREAWVDDEE